MVLVALALIAAEGLQPWAQRTVNGFVSGSYLRPRRDRPHARLRDPQARQLRPGRLPHLRRLHRVRVQRLDRHAADRRAADRRRCDRPSGRLPRADHVAADAEEEGRAAAAAADVARARVRAAQHDPVRRRHQAADARRQHHRVDLVPRPDDRAHRALRADHRDRRPLRGRLHPARDLRRPPDAGARRQLRPRRDDRDRHRPGGAVHLGAGRRARRPRGRPARLGLRAASPRTPASTSCCRCSPPSSSAGSATPSAPWPAAW